jgi:hypothetical protein
VARVGGVLVAAAVCPHPPLLVPEIGVGQDSRLDALRAACAQAVGALCAVEPDLVAVVGDAPRPMLFGRRAAGTLAPYGVAGTARWGEDASVEPTLPLSLTLGAWLLQAAGHVGAVEGTGVAATAPADAAARLGRRLTGLSARVGLLVMGDGSARRSTAGPGYLDARAAAFDASVAAALKDADPAALLALDPALAAELMAAGRASWQVLAGAVLASDSAWTSDLLYDDAPFGVGYLVASWHA